MIRNLCKRVKNYVKRLLKMNEHVIMISKGGVCMASVFDVAKYVLEKQGQMSTLKLQKLCYYAQAWSLAWTEEPLFQEEFQAWANGPVCSELFQRHKGNFMIGVDSLGVGNVSNLSNDQKDTINHVLDHYGAWDPYELREQTHFESPWKTARRGLPEGVSCNYVISKESMGEYYGNL